MTSRLVYWLHGEAGVAMIRRAASTSMYWAFKNAETSPAPINRKMGTSRLNGVRRQVLKNEIHHGEVVPVHAFIRDPIDRIRAGYQYFSAIGYREHITSLTTYENHVDNILDNGVTDIHWNNQAEYLSNIAKLECHLFEDLNLLWSKLGFPEMVHMNKSPQGRHPMNTDYRRDELNELYKADVELRHAI